MKISLLLFPKRSNELILVFWIENSTKIIGDFFSLFDAPSHQFFSSKSYEDSLHFQDLLLVRKQSFGSLIFNKVLEILNREQGIELCSKDIDTFYNVGRSGRCLAAKLAEIDDFLDQLSSEYLCSSEHLLASEQNLRQNLLILFARIVVLFEQGSSEDDEWHCEELLFDESLYVEGTHESKNGCHLATSN